MLQRTEAYERIFTKRLERRMSGQTVEKDSASRRCWTEDRSGRFVRLHHAPQKTLVRGVARDEMDVIHMVAHSANLRPETRQTTPTSQPHHTAFQNVVWCHHEKSSVCVAVVCPVFERRLAFMGHHKFTPFIHSFLNLTLKNALKFIDFWWSCIQKPVGPFYGPQCRNALFNSASDLCRAQCVAVNAGNAWLIRNQRNVAQNHHKRI